MSDEHFTVDGTLMEARASLKSFKPKDGEQRPIESTVFTTPVESRCALEASSVLALSLARAFQSVPRGSLETMRAR
jgi:hypothetical protein